MAEIELLMPSLGESVMEGTVLAWLKKEGDTIEEEESILEVATDKVDTEIPSLHGGVLTKIIVQEGQVAQVGKPIAVIKVDKEMEASASGNGNGHNTQTENINKAEKVAQDAIQEYSSIVARSEAIQLVSNADRFYSPLIRSIAKEEKVSQEELDQITGRGKNGRVTKEDLLTYLTNRQNKVSLSSTNGVNRPSITYNPQKDKVIEMDRMRKIIADRMLESKQISAHVTSFIETDVTNLMDWRKEKKQYFKEHFNVSLSINAIIMDAIAQTLKEFPILNASVDGNKIIYREDINLGMAVALSDGNLIVPVIRNADKLGISGIAATSYELAQKARKNELVADDLSGGTYSVSNIGTFNNVMGTPIIVQPQVAILAIGTAVKKPAVIETDEGDIIGIRNKMFLSHTYDHRVIDGAVGGSFLKELSERLENFDLNRAY